MRTGHLSVRLITRLPNVQAFVEKLTLYCFARHVLNISLGDSAIRLTAGEHRAVAVRRTRVAIVSFQQNGSKFRIPKCSNLLSNINSRSNQM